MIQYAASFFKAMNTNSHPGDIAHAACLGLLLAMLPKNNLTFTFLFFLTIFIRVNKGFFFISFILLGFVTPFADELINKTGYWVLSLEFLKPVFTFFYQTPFLGLFKLTNTMVAGALMLSLAFYIPVYFIVRFLTVQYRKYIAPKLFGGSKTGFIYKIPLLGHLVKLFELANTKDGI